MKTSERRHLKENELAARLARVQAQAAERRRPILLIVITLLLLAIAAGGYAYWRHQRNEQASAMLAQARSTAAKPVAPPAPATPAPPANASVGTTPAPVTPPPAPPAGSFSTEAARSEAALKQYQAAADAYPSTRAGIAAKYESASLLLELGRHQEAEQAFQDVATRDPDGIHGRMARLGIAAIQIQSSRIDPAIQTLQELSQRNDADLPVDGILMQLGDAYRRAGRVPEAIRAYTRISEEFPQSPYAQDARTEVDRLKAAPKA
jgi:tetratricopeptide (TPR) repeat protein